MYILYSVEEGSGRYAVEDDSRASDYNVGADVVNLRYVFNVLPVRPARENDGVVAVRELAYGEGRYAVAGGGLNGVNNSLV